MFSINIDIEWNACYSILVATTAFYGVVYVTTLVVVNEPRYNVSTSIREHEKGF